MKQLLLDVNILVDLCVERPGSTNARLALALAEARGTMLWVYAGSVQTLEYVVAAEIHTQAHAQGDKVTHTGARARARHRLERITAGYQWLAALAAEGPVFGAADPEDDQLHRALDRFEEGTAKLLTRDRGMLARYPGRALTPETLIEQQLHPQTQTPGIDFVDLKAQQAAIRPVLERNLHRVLHHGHYILGPEVRELEARLAAYTGAKHCITVASGTEALLISLMALGIGPGDEVITTPFTFVATAEVIVLVGATPVFIDIEPDTGNIDAGLIEARISERTKAILPVSLYGQPADMDAINAIAARRYHDLLAQPEGSRAKTPSRQADTPSQNALCAIAPLREPFQLLPWPKADRTSVFAQYTLRVPDRDARQAKLHAAGIPTAVHYPVPLNEQPAYVHLCCPDCTPVAQQLAREVMSLPMHPDLSEADQDRIVAALQVSYPQA